VVCQYCNESIFVGGLTCNWKLTTWYTGIRVLPGVTQHKAYVGNLSYNTTAKDLERFFLESFGCECIHVLVVEDREQTMERAIRLSNGARLDGRVLHVNEARGRQGRPGNGSGRRLVRF
jgi:cold-inducible RNA-binding protein